MKEDIADVKADLQKVMDNFIDPDSCKHFLPIQKDGSMDYVKKHLTCNILI